jgi:RNA-binding protein 5/10
LADSAVCEAGKKRKEALPPAPNTSDDKSDASQGPVYRDRAAERRTVFNQPSIPLPEPSRAGSKRKFAEGPAPPPPRAEPGLEPGKDEKNVGNQLLKKMGWTEGTGLGAEKAGRVDPVQALLFADRAGIGAGKGRDPVKYQGPDGYSSLVKDGVSTSCGVPSVREADV